MVFFKTDEYALFHWTTALKDQKKPFSKHSRFWLCEDSIFVLSTPWHMTAPRFCSCSGLPKGPVGAVKLIGAGWVPRSTQLPFDWWFSDWPSIQPDYAWILCAVGGAVPQMKLLKFEDSDIKCEPMYSCVKSKPLTFVFGLPSFFDFSITFILILKLECCLLYGVKQLLPLTWSWLLRDVFSVLRSVFSGICFKGW